LAQEKSIKSNGLALDAQSLHLDEHFVDEFCLALLRVRGEHLILNSLKCQRHSNILISILVVASSSEGLLTKY
jgi:hypothetical protein